MSNWPGVERLTCEDGSGRPECVNGTQLVKEMSEPGPCVLSRTGLFQRL
jgi:hypothetical protein